MNKRLVNTVMNLDLASKIIHALVRKSKRKHLKMVIAVVDAGANLVAFSRMDGSFLGSIDIAIKKAKTAALFNTRTGDLGAKSQPGKSLYGIEASNQGLITFDGGLPITFDYELIGGVGVSGDTVENDHAIAKIAQGCIYVSRC